MSKCKISPPPHTTFKEWTLDSSSFLWGSFTITKYLSSPFKKFLQCVLGVPNVAFGIKAEIFKIFKQMASSFQCVYISIGSHSTLPFDYDHKRVKILKNLFVSGNLVCL